MISDIINTVAPVGFATCSSQAMEFVFKKVVKTPVSGRMNLLIKGVCLTVYSITNNVLKQSTYDITHAHYLKKFTANEDVTNIEALVDLDTNEENTALEPLGINIEDCIDLL